MPIRRYLHVRRKRTGRLSTCYGSFLKLCFNYIRTNSRSVFTKSSPVTSFLHGVTVIIFVRFVWSKLANFPQRDFLFTAKCTHACEAMALVALTMATLSGSLAAHSSPPLRVMFVGNSFTFVNELPYQLQHLAASLNVSIEVCAPKMHKLTHAAACASLQPIQSALHNVMNVTHDSDRVWRSVCNGVVGVCGSVTPSWDPLHAQNLFCLCMRFQNY